VQGAAARRSQTHLPFVQFQQQVGRAFVGVEPAEPDDLTRHAQPLGRPAAPPGLPQGRGLCAGFGKRGPEGCGVHRDDVGQGPDQEVGVYRSRGDDHVAGEAETDDLASPVVQHGAARDPAARHEPGLVAFGIHRNGGAGRLVLRRSGEAATDQVSSFDTYRGEAGQHNLQRGGEPRFKTCIRLILHGLRPTARLWRPVLHIGWFLRISPDPAGGVRRLERPRRFNRRRPRPLRGRCRLSDRRSGCLAPAPAGRARGRGGGARRPELVGRRLGVGGRTGRSAAGLFRR